MPGFLFVATLLSAILSLPLSKHSGWQTGVFALLSITGAVLADYYGPPGLLNGFVFASAVIIGAFIGRTVPALFAPMALFLAIISTLDVLWIWSGASPGALLDPYASFSLVLGSGFSSIGSLDLMVASAITTHWRRREATIPVSLAAAPLGMILSNVFVSITGMTNLALLPFITAGWLITQTWHRTNQARQ